ncbi:hypothetical protein B0H17DRAFT_1205689 [Mycena rosella]|uniref:Uncharacterized protein n=1 Tax=Mycena rosella TaxID=1033263 RepID=A0AAD7D749_MYCRO|nr:hypothetical protein B0H17DRAFT_1205689 [Mycena rosella]
MNRRLLALFMLLFVVLAIVAAPVDGNALEVRKAAKKVAKPKAVAKPKPKAAAKPKPKAVAKVRTILLKYYNQLVNE